MPFVFVFLFLRYAHKNKISVAQFRCFGPKNETLDEKPRSAHEPTVVQPDLGNSTRVRPAKAAHDGGEEWVFFG